MKLTLWLLLICCLPGLAVARTKIQLTGCEKFLLLSAVHYDRMNDADWVMQEALRVNKELEGKKIKDRNKTPIHYFREQIPAVIQMLRQITEDPDRRYYFSDPLRMDEERGSLVTHPTTVKQAIDKLVEEGINHYRNNTATLEWFPMFILEVIAIKKYVALNSDSFDQVLYFRTAQAKHKLLEQLESGNYLHWPTPVNIKIKHFEDWHLGIKPLGFSLDFSARFNYDTLENQDDFALYVHDLTHNLPDAIFPYRRQYILPNRRIDMRIAFEQDINQKSLLRIFKYMYAHESGALYEYFAFLKRRGYEAAERRFKEDIKYYDENKIWQLRLLNRNDLFFEMTDQLQMMDDRALDIEIEKAVQRFQEIVFEVFKMELQR